MPVRDKLLLGIAAGLVLTLLVGLVWPRTPTATPAAAPEDPAPAADRLAPWMRPLAPGEQPPQFVLFSFDGAGSHEHWQRVMQAAQTSEAHVTGFLSGVYLLTDDERDSYHPPGHATGHSEIGFGGTSADVDQLIADLTAARRAGHEIGTHYNGHFCAGSGTGGGSWSTAMWNAELEQFFGFVAAAEERGLDLDPADVRGGRTPCLEGQWDAAYPAMRAHGLTYDTSRTSDGIAWPSEEQGVREFWMPQVHVPALGRKVILMDYNLWFALNDARAEPARADEFRDVVLGAYRAAYTAALRGNRAPLVLGNHFNDWSGGGFAAAVEQFITEVCRRPETVCATHSEVNAWMDLQDPAVLAHWRGLPPAQVTPATTQVVQG